MMAERERKKRDRQTDRHIDVRKKHRPVASHPNQGSHLQPRSVPGPEIKPTAFCPYGTKLQQLSHPARARRTDSYWT